MIKNTLLFLAPILSIALFLTGCQKEVGSSASGSISESIYKNAAKLGGDVQTITTKFSSRSYAPITVQAGVPVKWTIQMDEKDLNSCNEEIQIPEYNVVQDLSAGETVIEFTPTKAGTFPYSCWMGMIRSKITVVDDLEVNGESAADSDANISEKIGVLDFKSSNLQSSDSNVAIAEVNGDNAKVSLQITPNGYEPSIVIVQKNVLTDFVFDVGFSSCAIDVVFPQLGNYINLTKNNIVTVMPSEDFNIECIMGMYGVTVLTVDDIRSSETASLIQDVEQHIDSYAFQNSGCGMTNDFVGNGGGCCGSGQ